VHSRQQTEHAEDERRQSVLDALCATLAEVLPTAGVQSKMHISVVVVNEVEQLGDEVLLLVKIEAIFVRHHLGLTLILD